MRPGGCKRNSMIWRFTLLLFVAWPTPQRACARAIGLQSSKLGMTLRPSSLGTVVLAAPDGDERQAMFQSQFVRVRVDEAFKGVTTGQTIELYEEANDCAAKFRNGQRAVFYLFPEATAVGSCDRAPTRSATLNPPETTCCFCGRCRNRRSAPGFREQSSCMRTHRSKRPEGQAVFRTLG